MRARSWSWQVVSLLLPHWNNVPGERSGACCCSQPFPSCQREWKQTASQCFLSSAASTRLTHCSPPPIRTSIGEALSGGAAPLQHARMSAFMALQGCVWAHTQHNRSWVMGHGRRCQKARVVWKRVLRGGRRFPGLWEQKCLFFSRVEDLNTPSLSVADSPHGDWDCCSLTSSIFTINAPAQHLLGNHEGAVPCKAEEAFSDNLLLFDLIHKWHCAWEQQHISRVLNKWTRWEGSQQPALENESCLPVESRDYLQASHTRITQQQGWKWLSCDRWWWWKDGHDTFLQPLKITVNSHNHCLREALICQCKPKCGDSISYHNSRADTSLRFYLSGPKTSTCAVVSLSVQCL